MMLHLKNIKVTNYSQDFLKKAIQHYINYRQMNRNSASKYYATETGREKALHRAKVYYWKIKKNAYHKIYNPQAPKL